MWGARTIRRAEEGWPRALDLLADPPDFLRIRGQLPRPGDRTVAVVGSRAAGASGLEQARAIGAALARAGAWVVSGGAAGIDAAAHAGAVEAGGRTVVGVNRFVTDERSAVPLLRVDPAREAEQIARVREVRSGRDPAALKRALDRLEEAARDDRGALFPHVLDAVRAFGTVGEISDRLRTVFGVFQQVLTI